MWQLVEAIRGLADACQVLGVPVTGGNVSLYNGTGEPGRIDSAIHPTPVVGVLGVLDDVADATPSGWTRGRARPSTCWAPRAPSSTARRGPTSCTATSAACRRRSTSTPSARWPRSWSRASRDDLVDAAHDLSEGGLAQALVESSLRFGVGVQVVARADSCARDGVTPFEALFSESTARVLVAVPRSEEVRLVDLCTARGVPALRLGETAESCSPGAGTPTDDADHVHGPAVEVAGRVHAAPGGGPRGPRGDAPALLRLTARRARAPNPTWGSFCGR